MGVAFSNSVLCHPWMALPGMWRGREGLQGTFWWTCTFVGCTEILPSKKIPKIENLGVLGDPPKSGVSADRKSSIL